MIILILLPCDLKRTASVVTLSRSTGILGIGGVTKIEALIDFADVLQTCKMIRSYNTTIHVQAAELELEAEYDRICTTMDT